MKTKMYYTRKEAAEMIGVAYTRLTDGLLRNPLLPKVPKGTHACLTLADIRQCAKVFGLELVLAEKK